MQHAMQWGFLTLHDQHGNLLGEVCQPELVLRLYDFPHRLRVGKSTCVWLRLPQPPAALLQPAHRVTMWARTRLGTSQASLRPHL